MRGVIVAAIGRHLPGLLHQAREQLLWWCAAHRCLMAAPRLTDSQKQELVARYREGETAQALAAAYGCSPNTVSRVVKAALDPEELAALKKQSRSRSAAPAATDLEPLPHQETPVAEVAEVVAVAGDLDPDPEPEAESQPENDDPHALAVDDADDYGDDDSDDADDDGEDEGDDDEALTPAAASGALVEAQPLLPGVLPSSVYLLVDKTVELQPRPLSEFPELGNLPEAEQQLQGLMLYANQRLAKRQCGRTQRVIKFPDSGVLERCSSYLVAQGITRLVLESGALFAIPGA